MSSCQILDFIPDLYRHFLSGFFENAIPEETAAECFDCSMVSNDGGILKRGGVFSLKTKCCTHYPNLSNYLIGALLNSKVPGLEEGRQRIKTKIRRRIGVEPQGILRPPKYDLLIKRAPHAFGQSKTLICPYYEGKEGKCTIWPFRNATCSTWFCKYNAGEEGMRFWSSLKRYLKHVEMTLVQLSLYKMGLDLEKVIFTDSSYDVLKAQELDELPPDPVAYEAIWDKWVGHEEDFYINSFSLIIALNREDFEQITGITQKILLDDLSKKHRNLSNPKLPNRLKRNPKLEVEKLAENRYALIGYSPLDPIEVPKKVYDILDFFDGKKNNDEVCRLVHQDMHIEPAEDLLYSLYQFRILVDNEQD